jgi:3-methylcrotonyl-CoA carboxylase beta subunit
VRVQSSWTRRVADSDADSPRFLWTWPGSRTGVMGAEQLSSVMATISSKDPAANERLRGQIEAQSEALYGSARLWDDGIILPEETRDALGLGLAVSAGKRDEGGTPGAFGVYRM